MPWLSTPRILPTDKRQIDARDIGTWRSEGANQSGTCVGRTADHLQRLAVARIDSQDLQLVGIRMAGSCQHLGNNEGLQRGLVVKLLDLQTDHGQGIDDLSSEASVSR